MFPAILLPLLLLDTFAGAGSELRNMLLDSFQQIVARGTSALITKTTGELNAIAVIGAGASWAAAGAAWATLNGTWAMMTGLNRAYEVEEERRWCRIVTIAFGLTISFLVMGLMARGQCCTAAEPVQPSVGILECILSPRLPGASYSGRSS
jgi:uncharacterized BrkB/YihY/UPF0761 family membrane protein